MLYAEPVLQKYVSGDVYAASNYHLSLDKLSSDYSPVRFERELRLFRGFCVSGSVLDVGCSTGAFLHRLITAWPDAYRVTGTDLAGPSIDYAAGRGIEIIATPFLEWDPRARMFDAVTFWAVMEHLDEPGKFLKKAADVIRIGGHCFILVPNVRSLAVRLLGPRYRYIMPEHLNYFTARALARFVGNEERFVSRELSATHFNPVVIWHDLKNRAAAVDELERARLLKKTTRLKESSGLRLVKKLYNAVESLLGRLLLADNLVIVLERIESKKG